MKGVASTGDPVRVRPRLLGELDRETQSFGLRAAASPAHWVAVSPRGGIAWIMRKHDLAIDHSSPSTW